MKYKIFSLLFLFCLISQICYAQTNVYKRQHYNPYRYSNPYRNYSPYYAYRDNYYSNGGYYSPNFTDMSALERYALNKNYSGETELMRLQRLERLAFGAIQQGDFNRRYENVKGAILSRPQAVNGRVNNKSIWRTVGDYFGGQLTGYTPSISAHPMNPDWDIRDAYQSPFDTNSGYGNSKYVEYNNSPFSRGYQINNFGAGSSSGIRILD